MIRQRTSFSAAVLGLVGVAVSANADLVDRGNGLIYDTELRITWLQDANYAATSGFDPDGRMALGEATAWVESLTYAGYDDWRLPKNSGDVHVDPVYGAVGELGMLFSSLGNPAGGQFSNTGPFSNVQPEYALAADPAVPPLPYEAYAFATQGGYEYASGNANQVWAWPVRDGDVVPEPSASALLGGALLALAALGRSARPIRGLPRRDSY